MSRARFIFALILIFNFASATPVEDVRELLLKTTGITDADIKNAASSSKIGLFELYALAVNGTERLVIDGENAIQADYRRWESIGSLFPVVSLRSTNFIQDEDPAISGRKSSVFLYARQNLLLGLDQYANIKGSSVDRIIQRYKLSHNAGRFLMDVAVVYMLTVQVDKNLKNRVKILENYRGIASELKRRVALGRSKESDLLRTNAQIYGIEAEISLLMDRKRSALVSLYTLVGYSGKAELDDKISIAASPDELSESAKLANARYDVRAAAEEVELAETKFLASLSGNLPSIYIEGAYRLFQEEKTGRDYYASLGVEMPLVDGGVTTSRSLETSSAKRQAELRLAQTRRNAIAEIEDARASYKSSFIETESYRKALEAAEAEYAVVLREYGFNLVTILDVFDSLTALVSARDNYERSQLNKCLSRVKLGVATGEFLGAGVAALRPARTEGNQR